MTNSTINSITEDYCNFLKEYIKRKNCPHKKEAVSLIPQLEEIETIDALKVLLEGTNELRNPTFFGSNVVHLSKKISMSSIRGVKSPGVLNPPPVDPDEYLTRLSLCKRKVDQLMVANRSISDIHDWLKSIKTTAATAPIINILDKVLSNPHCLLYDKTCSLLKTLEDKTKVLQIIDHLPQQPKIDRPAHPLQGTFDSVVPLDEQHQACLDLLRNNTKSVKESSEIGILANCFLQTTLILYQSIYTPKPVAMEKPYSCAIC